MIILCNCEIHVDILKIKNYNKEKVVILYRNERIEDVAEDSMLRTANMDFERGVSVYPAIAV